MNSKVIFAFFSRVGVSLINFLIIIITAKYLGAEARGNISLILLGITFSQVVHQFIGGNPLVYFAKKTALKNLLIPSYVWAIISSAAVSYILTVTKQIPEEFSQHVFFLSLVQSILASHLTILLAYEKIKEQNAITFLQAAVTIGWLFTQIFILENRNINQYINALYLSFSVGLMLTIALLIRSKTEVTHEHSLSVSLIRSILSYGFVIQTTNIMQMLNYRLSFFLINSYAGTAAVGVFSTAIAIGESVWLFSKSLTNIQYPKIVHSADTKTRIDLTIRYAKAGLAGTIILVLPLLIAPVAFFEFVLGKEFSEIKKLIVLLSPGLIAIGFTTLFAHYFSGISQNRINLFASGTGLIITCFAGFSLIPGTLVTGACITADLSYLGASVILIFVFIRTTNSKLSALLPEMKDIKNISSFLK